MRAVDPLAEIVNRQTYTETFTYIWGGFVGLRKYTVNSYFGGNTELKRKRREYFARQQCHVGEKAWISVGILIGPQFPYL